MIIAKAPLRRQEPVAKGLALILAGAIILCSAAGNKAVHAADYYVDGENGNDVLGDGSSDAPWKTFDKAVSQARLVRPSTVYFRSGYYGKVDVDYLPTACSDVAGVDYEAGWNNAITFAAEPGQTPTCGQIIIRQAFDRYFIFDGFRIEDRTNDLSVPGEPYLVQVRGARQVKLLNLTVRGQEGAYCSRSGVTAAGIEVSCAGGTDPVINGVLIEDCDISHVEVGIKCKAIQSAAETFGWGNVIRGNYIHDIYGTAVSLALADNTSELLIENNVMANSNPLIQWMQIKGTVQQAFSDGEKVSQSSSGAAGTIYASGPDWLNIFVTSPVLFDTGGAITADDGTGAMNEPAEIIKKDYTHASGVSIRCRNVTVRGNVFRAFGTTSGIMTYPPYAGSHPQQNGYTNVVVENNLFYDMGAVYAVRLENLGSNIRFNNNTVIGYHIGTGISRYGTQVRLLPLDGLASDKRHDIAFYNNLVVGGVSLSYGDMHLTGFSEDYNIFWSCSNPETGWWLPAGLGNLQGSHTFIATADTSQPSTFEYNFFADCDYSRGSDFVRYADGGPNGRLLDYRLLNTAQAVDFCSLANGPAVDANGVSRIDIAGFGNDGDNYADAGCYECTQTDASNHIPVLAEIGNRAVTEGESLTFTVDATDADGDTITFSAQGLPDGASLTGRSFSWTPAYDQAGAYQVTFIASDGKALDSETITINVGNVNRPPVLWEIGDKAASEGSLLTFSVVASDPDGDDVTYSARNLPTGATFANRTFNWTPGYDNAGAYQVTFVVSDGQAQDSETITITVANLNRAPVMDRIGGKSVDENSPLSFSVNATDPDGETLQYSVGALPPGASFAARQFAWTPDYDQAGGYQVTFTVSDGQARDSETVSIIVGNVNRPPVLDAIGAKSVGEDRLLTFTVNASDPDPDTIQYSATGLPSGATLTGQTFNWTPTHSQADETYSVTFIASDGHLQDSQAVTITVYSRDTSPPVLTNRSPAPDSIQAPLNTLTILHLVDPGEGVDANTVTIKLDGNIVYEGDTPQYNSICGDCRRTGDKADYTFAFQSKQMFDFDQTVTVTVGAADLEGNVMPESSYTFKTEMRSFGRNMEVAWNLPEPGKAAPATVVDGAGYIWAVWHAGPGGDRDIYISALEPGAASFNSHVRIDDDAAEQCYPAVAVDAADRIYVVWQDRRRGNWDIYLSTSVDGASWSAPVRISDSNDNQTYPVIAIDGRNPNRVNVAWQDDRAGNQDIYIAASSDGFATRTITRITYDSADQLDPAIAVDSSDAIYVVWTDFRGDSADIYGAASNNGPWTNMPIAISSADQSNPAIATEDAGSILHLLWVDNSSGSPDVCYASSSGLPDSPPPPRNIIDDTSGADQATPALAAVGVSGSGLRVFSCWQDSRNVTTTGGDTDLYFAEIGSASPINVLVGDDRTNADQSAPALGVDSHGFPYIIWADTRDPNAMICYAGSTFVENEAVESMVVAASSGATVGTEPESITTAQDVSLVVPPGAFPYDLTVTIGRIQNPQAFSMPCLNEYDFGPSGVVFSAPVTVTIPYEVADGGSLASPYWYDSFTGALSQQGITDVETIVISPTLHALRFKTTHFTPYYVLSGSSTSDSGGGGGGGGGGCAVSAVGQGDIVSFFVPYVGLAVAMALLRFKDTRSRRMRHSSRR